MRKVVVIKSESRQILRREAVFADLNIADSSIGLVEDYGPRVSFPGCSCAHLPHVEELLESWLVPKTVGSPIIVMPMPIAHAVGLGHVILQHSQPPLKWGCGGITF